MFNDTNKEFNKTIHLKKLLANYKTSAEQWKKLYNDEHKELFKLKSDIKKILDDKYLNSNDVCEKIQKLLQETCKHGTPIDMECTRCLTDSELLLDV